MKEQPKIETKEERPKYEIELEQRPMPQEGETHPNWLKRIGGPNVKIVEDLEKYSLPKEKKDRPLVIDKKGDFVVSSENIGAYFDKTKIDAELEKNNPNINFVKERGEYQFKKELFRNPELYFHVIGEELKEERKIVAEKNFGEGVEKWIKELKGEKVEEKGGKKEKKKKPEKEEKKLNMEEIGQLKGEMDEYTQELKSRIDEIKLELEELQTEYDGLTEFSGAIESGDYEEITKKPLESKKERPKKKPASAEAAAGKEKPPTLDEQIAAKEKELEEVEGKHNIYYSPRVRDLLGLYYDKRLKDLREEIEGLGKEKKKPSLAKATEGKEPKEMPEKLPTAKEYLTHIKDTDKLFNEMTRARWEVKKGKGKEKKEARLKYEKAKKEWQDAYNKTLAMESCLAPKVLEKISKILEKERAKAKKVGLLKKIWNFFKFIGKTIGKEALVEVKRDALKKQLEVVKQRIKKGGVLGRATLEKEQKRLEKRLKELKK